MSYYSYGRKMGRSYYNGGESTGSWILVAIGLFVFILIWNSICRSASRSDSGMVYIEDGYCYHEDSYIIYQEYETGRYGTDTTYTVYLDKDGHKCRYDIETGNWIAFIETENGMKDLGISKENEYPYYNYEYEYEGGDMGW